ncbi:MAG TPA: peptidyl-prolyl cis-trans isomerase [Syntrophales bacterium]|nr:peptidyl-prolyl cis-trans isomerase [Syntrophales bacterium]
MKRWLLAVFILAFAVSCSKLQEGKSDYVAKMGDVTLTEEDVRVRFKNLPPSAMQLFQGPDGMKIFVEELVKRELLYLAAKEKGIEQNEEVIKKLNDTRKDIVVTYFVDQEIKAAAMVTEKDVKDYYDSHKDEFLRKDKVTVSRILVKTENDAKKVVERVEEGEDFASVAAEVSLDRATARAGGNMGTFGPSIKNKPNPELQEVIFRLGKGQMSDPIYLKDGVHILKVTDIVGALLEFDKVKEAISRKIKAERRKTAFNKVLESSMKPYKVDINNKALEKLTVSGVGSSKFYSSHQ